MKYKTLSKKFLVFAINLLVILALVFFPSYQTFAAINKSQDPLENTTVGVSLNNSGDDKLFEATSEPYQKIDPKRFESFIIDIPQLENRTRSIHVYLPVDYKDNLSTYPVVYILDSQSIFINDVQTNFEWYLDQSLYEYYSGDNQDEIILVGVESDRMYKWDEYSPWVKSDMYYWLDPYEANRVEGGEGDAFLDFLVNTLKPTIDTEYRTKQSRDNTAISGAKMAGLLSIYAGLTRSDVYSKVITLSPSIWFAENGGPWLSKNRLISLIKKSDRSENVSFTIDIASEDRTIENDFYPVIYDSRGKKLSYSQAYLEGTQHLVDNLIDKGFPTRYISKEINYSGEFNEIFPETTDIITGVKIYLPIIFTPPLVAPLITSPNSTTFTKGVYKKFTITSTGNPTPSISYTGTLPKGITFKDNGNGTAELYGTTTEDVSKTFPLTINANNGVSPAAVQNFSLIVHIPIAPIITSPASTTFTKGVYKKFTITTTGSPIPSISYTGTLPKGITFKDNGNGTAELYGTTTEDVSKTFPLIINANNGVSPAAVQNFNLIVYVPIAPSFTSKNTTTFYTNQENSFLIVATGEPLPSIKIIETLPSWLSFENHGNGTATLSGSPSIPATVTSYSFSIVASNGVAPAATQTFTLKVAYPESFKCPTSDSCILPFTFTMSPYLNRTRQVWVYLPPNYNSSGDFYQVIYLTPAQALFADDIDVPLPDWRDWQFDETLNYLYGKNNNKGTIAVAIESDARYLWDEYSAWDNLYMTYWLGDSSQNFTGKGAQFLSFITNELKPFVDSSFRTLPGRTNTAIGGGSRYGLFALYAGLVKPDIFSKVMAMSPAIWVANNSRTWKINNGFLGWFDSHTAPGNVLYYQYVGTQEWSGIDDYPPPDPNITGEEPWPTIYLEGVNITKLKLEKDGVPSSNIFRDINTGASWPPGHLPSTWRHYVDDALLDLGFYTNH
jgi:predicted alpha/beta superfamily hydrolase